MRVVFMGNGAFGVPSLRSLAHSAHQVLAVVTNPDKPAGRHQVPTPTPIKQEALKLGLPIWEVASPKEPALPERLQALKADIFVVVAYPIIPRRVRTIPPLGAINIHPSLLPAYRGPAPIPWSIICGDTVTGVTIFRIGDQVDAGDILLQRAYPLPEDWDAGQLERFLAEVSADLLLEVLEGLALGTIQPVPQPQGKEVSYAPKLSSENTRIVWHKTAHEVYNFVRGLSPQPRAWTIFQGKRLQILKAEKMPARRTMHPPGTIWQEGGQLLVACGDAPLRLVEVHLEGKKPVSGAEFVQGYVKNAILHLD
ncbi:MAG: methionyl-tRNA formyltransferase [Bacteroidia bacterium]